MVPRFLTAVLAEAEKRALHRLALRGDVETVDWLNYVLAQFWTVYEPTLAESMRGPLQRILEAARPRSVASIELVKFTLGPTAPFFRSARVLAPVGAKTLEADQLLAAAASASRSTAMIDLLVDTVVRAPAAYAIVEVRLSAKMLRLKVPIAVSNLMLQGQLMLGLKFMSKSPLLEHITFSFLSQPEVDLSIRAMHNVDVMDMPFLSQWLEGSIDSAIASTMVLPNKLEFNINEMFNGVDELDVLDGSPAYFARSQAVGILQVTISSATLNALIEREWSALDARTNTTSTTPASGPLQAGSTLATPSDLSANTTIRCFVDVGGRVHASRAIKRHHLADWSQTFCILVHDVNSQRVSINVKASIQEPSTAAVISPIFLPTAGDAFHQFESGETEVVARVHMPETVDCGSCSLDMYEIVFQHDATLVTEQVLKRLRPSSSMLPVSRGAVDDHEEVGRLQATFRYHALGPPPASVAATGTMASPASAAGGPGQSGAGVPTIPASSVATPGPNGEDFFDASGSAPTKPLSSSVAGRKASDEPSAGGIFGRIFESGLAAEAGRAATIVREMATLPRAVLHRAKGVAVISVVRIGFLASVRFGTGLVLARLPSGAWSAPSAIALASLSGGLEAGAEKSDFLIILNTSDAVNAFASGTASLGGNVSVAAGPVGRQVAAELSTSNLSSAFSYSKTKGLFVGVSLTGTVLIERKDANRKFYGMQVSARELLSRTIDSMSEIEPLYQALADSQMARGVRVAAFKPDEHDDKDSKLFGKDRKQPRKASRTASSLAISPEDGDDQIGINIGRYCRKGSGVLRLELKQVVLQALDSASEMAKRKISLEDGSDRSFSPSGAPTEPGELFCVVEKNGRRVFECELDPVKLTPLGSCSSVELIVRNSAALKLHVAILRRVAHDPAESSSHFGFPSVDAAEPPGAQAQDPLQIVGAVVLDVAQHLPPGTPAGTRNDRVVVDLKRDATLPSSFANSVTARVLAKLQQQHTANAAAHSASSPLTHTFEEDTRTQRSHSLPSGIGTPPPTAVSGSRSPSSALSASPTAPASPTVATSAALGNGTVFSGGASSNSHPMVFGSGKLLQVGKLLCALSFRYISLQFEPPGGSSGMTGSPLGFARQHQGALGSEDRWDDFVPLINGARICLFGAVSDNSGMKLVNQERHPSSSVREALLHDATMSGASSERAARLILTIIEAKHLPGVDRNMLSDPFVVVKMDGRRLHRTKPIKRDLNPRFNETTVVELVDRLYTRLLFVVKDWNLSHSSVPIGNCEICLGDFFADSKMAAAEQETAKHADGGVDPALSAAGANGNTSAAALYQTNDGWIKLNDGADGMLHIRMQLTGVVPPGSPDPEKTLSQGPLQRLLRAATSSSLASDANRTPGDSASLSSSLPSRRSEPSPSLPLSPMDLLQTSSTPPPDGQGRSGLLPRRVSILNPRSLAGPPAPVGKSASKHSILAGLAKVNADVAAPLSSKQSAPPTPGPTSSPHEFSLAGLTPASGSVSSLEAADGASPSPPSRLSANVPSSSDNPAPSLLPLLQISHAEETDATSTTKPTSAVSHPSAHSKLQGEAASSQPDTNHQNALGASPDHSLLARADSRRSTRSADSGALDEQVLPLSEPIAHNANWVSALILDENVYLRLGSMKLDLLSVMHLPEGGPQRYVSVKVGEVKVLRTGKVPSTSTASLASAAASVSVHASSTPLTAATRCIFTLNEHHVFQKNEALSKCCVLIGSLFELPPGTSKLTLPYEREVLLNLEPAPGQILVRVTFDA
ncbi:DUF500 and SH3 domain-containing protein, variant [Capsaspora owczarzaki ATCC 30864]|nr:DUF500 and SH3 domain-containing protein, variant [Capsaspora owczarzaki ATCC 30864]|eukprot:XP_011270372.1 DUF500 and SH3 domain-containing protein, variant [Capsaspora owczarzaki ATCC 30864]